MLLAWKYLKLIDQNSSITQRPHCLWFGHVICWYLLISFTAKNCAQARLFAPSVDIQHLSLILLDIFLCRFSRHISVEPSTFTRRFDALDLFYRILFGASVLRSLSSAITSWRQLYINWPHNRCWPSLVSLDFLVKIVNNDLSKNDVYWGASPLMLIALFNNVRKYFK